MAEVTANRDGEWAVVLDTPLAAGDHLVTLRAKTGGPDAVSEQSLAVGIRQGQAPLVVLAEADAPSRVLQTPAPTVDAPATPAPAAKAPEGAGRTAEAGPAEPRLAIGSVDYQDGGRLIVAGRAESGVRLRAYLNDTYVGDGISADARFAFSLNTELPPGRYRVRVDEIEPQTGTVVKRVEARFERAPSVLAARGERTGAGAGQAADAALGEPQVVAIRRGDNLWTIARKQYGKGHRYTTIYEANASQIRNPSRIYPNQIFVLPVSQTR
jgi:nucleoid-associated protein YgaU